MAHSTPEGTRCRGFPAQRRRAASAGVAAADERCWLHLSPLRLPAPSRPQYRLPAQQLETVLSAEFWGSGHAKPWLRLRRGTSASRPKDWLPLPHDSATRETVTRQPDSFSRAASCNPGGVGEQALARYCCALPVRVDAKEDVGRPVWPHCHNRCCPHRTHSALRGSQAFTPGDGAFQGRAQRALPSSPAGAATTRSPTGRGK